MHKKTSILKLQMVMGGGRVSGGGRGYRGINIMKTIQLKIKINKAANVLYITYTTVYFGLCFSIYFLDFLKIIERLSRKKKEVTHHLPLESVFSSLNPHHRHQSSLCYLSLATSLGFSFITNLRFLPCLFQAHCHHPARLSFCI